MIIDAHTHLGEATYPKWSASVEELLGEMDRFGIDKAVVFPQFNVVPGDYSTQNEWLAGIVRQYKDRLWGFARINPLKKNCLEVLRRSIEDEGFRGVKLHSNDDLWDYSPLCIQMLENIRKYKLPILLHSSAEILEKIVSNFLEVPIIFAHMTGGLPSYMVRDIWKIAEKYKNIYFETSAIMMPKAAIWGTVEKFGAERVILGSNFPLGDMGFSLKRLQLAGIDGENYGKITGENILRILGEKR